MLLSFPWITQWSYITLFFQQRHGTRTKLIREISILTYASRVSEMRSSSLSPRLFAVISMSWKISLVVFLSRFPLMGAPDDWNGRARNKHSQINEPKEYTRYIDWTNVKQLCSNIFILSHCFCTKLILFDNVVFKNISMTLSPASSLTSSDSFRSYNKYITVLQALQ